MSTKYAFLDRDGTLIYEPQDTHQIDRLEKLQILEGVIEGLQRLRDVGYKLILISNQDGIGTPSFPREAFKQVQNHILETFQNQGIMFEAVFVCPHLSEDNCSCRKPKTGLVDSFLEEHKEEIDWENSFMCGDRDTDEEFAQNIGLRFIPTQTNGSFGEVLKKVYNGG